MNTTMPLLLLAALIPCAAVCEEGANSSSWAKLVERLADYSISLHREAKTTSVIRCSVKCMVPEVDGLKIRRVYLVVRVDSVLRGFEEIEGEAKPIQVKPGDELCVELPIGCRPPHIGPRDRNLIMLIVQSKNKITGFHESAIADYKVVNAGMEPDPAYVVDVTNKMISRLGLQNIPKDCNWVSLLDMGLLGEKSEQWDDFFSRVDVEAAICGVLGSENASIIEGMEAKKNVKNFLGYLKKVSEVGSPEVKQAAAERLLSAGDSYGFVLYGNIIKFIMSEITKEKYKLQDPNKASGSLEWHDQRKRALGAMLPLYLARVRAWTGDTRDEIELGDLVSWLEKDHADLVFDADAKKFKKK